jgi:hypothetical protein
MRPTLTSDPAQLAECRAVFAEMSASWAFVSAKTAPDATSRAEAQVFGQMVVALAEWLGPSTGKSQTGPLQELQLLAQGISAHQGKLLADKSQLWWPEHSITGVRHGERIVMTAQGFSKLCDACLNDVAHTSPRN